LELDTPFKSELSKRQGACGSQALDIGSDFVRNNAAFAVYG